MTALNLTLRQADPEDAETVLGINLRSIFELCTKTYDASVLRQWVGMRTSRYFAKSIARGQIYPAELGCGPVGFIDVVKGEVRGIFILPGYEGHGIGRFLLAQAIEKAADGEHPVKVTSSLNAVPFYQHFGFRSVTETKFGRNGIELPLVQMELEPAHDRGQKVLTTC